MIQNLSNTVFISTANESANGTLLRVPRLSGQAISEAQPMLSGAGQNLTWQFRLLDGAVINTANSYVQYKMKMQFKVRTLTNDAASVGAQQGRIFADLVKSPSV